MKRFSLNILLALFLTAGLNSAWAVPVLQLGIVDGTYDNGTESIVTSDDTFTLVAFGKATGNKAIDINSSYYISIAVTPMPEEFPVPNIGSFGFEGNTYDINDMVFGNPPLEDSLDKDPKDLSSHSIFNSYFMEFEFNFSGSTSASVNTQDTPGFNPLVNAGSDLYFETFEFDVSGLFSGFGLHFDLYNTQAKSGDIDVDDFAPYSHDAGTAISAVPEPSILFLFSFALLLLGFSHNYQSRKNGFVISA